MSKSSQFALLVGIDDYPGEGNDLASCVNDVMAWRDLLLDSFSFERSHVRLLLNQRATRDAVLVRLRWLVEQAKSGDTIVFVYSGHGTSITERNDQGFTDEIRDQALVLFGDNEHSAYLLDDDLFSVFQKVRNGVQITCIIDSCYSGGMDKIPDVKYLPPPPDIYHRSSDSYPVRRVAAFESPSSTHKLIKSSSTIKAVTLSACSDDEVAAANRDETEGKSVFSYYAIRRFEKIALGHKECSSRKIIKGVFEDIKAAGHPQSPQIKGNDIQFDCHPFGSYLEDSESCPSSETSTSGVSIMPKFAITVQQAKSLASMLIDQRRTKALEDWQICEDALEIVGVPSNTRSEVCNDLFPHKGAVDNERQDVLTTYEDVYAIAKKMKLSLQSNKSLSDRDICEDVLETFGVPTHTREEVCNNFDD